MSTTKNLIIKTVRPSHTIKLSIPGNLKLWNIAKIATNSAIKVKADYGSDIADSIKNWEDVDGVDKEDLISDCYLYLLENKYLLKRLATTIYYNSNNMEKLYSKVFGKKSAEKTIKRVKKRLSIDRSFLNCYSLVVLEEGRHNIINVISRVQWQHAPKKYATQYSTNSYTMSPENSFMIEEFNNDLKEILSKVEYAFLQAFIELSDNPNRPISSYKKTSLPKLEEAAKHAGLSDWTTKDINTLNTRMKRRAKRVFTSYYGSSEEVSKVAERKKKYDK